MSDQSAAALDAALDAADILHAAHQSLHYEVRHLRAIQAWATAQQPVRAGQQAVVKKSFGPIKKDSGWYGARECLVPGATGTISRVEFNGHHGYWYADFIPDVEWWLGWDNRPHMSADRSVFAISVEHLRPRTEDDRGLSAPNVEADHG